MIQKTTLWTSEFRLILLVTFLFYFALQLLTGAFPTFMTEKTGSPILGGLMTTSFMLAAIIIRPLYSIFIGTKHLKVSLLLTLTVIFISLICSINEDGVRLLTGLRILEGMGFGVVTTLLATIATRLIPHDRIGEGIGYFGMSTSLGTILGPMMGLVLLNQFSFFVLLLIISGVIIVSGLLIFFIHVQDNSTNRSADLPLKSSWIEGFFDKRVILPSFLVMLFYGTYSSIVNFISSFGEEVHLRKYVPLFYVVIALMIVLIRPIAGKIYDQAGHAGLIYGGGVSGIIGLIVLSQADHVFPLVSAAILYGATYSIMQPTFQSWAISEVQESKKGTANAMILSGMDLGMALGSPLLGNVAFASTYSTMYLLSSLLIVMLIVVYRLKHNHLPRRKIAED